MPAPNISFNSNPNASILRDARTPVFGRKTALSLQSAPSRPLPARIAIVGNHLPRQCGIATFTTDLSDAITAEYGADVLSVVAVNDPQSSYTYPTRVRFQIEEGDISSYRATANFLNSGNFDLVCLQHEYGIFGGKAGSHVLELLQRLTMPVVTTLHTVLSQPDLDQRTVMQQIATRSDRLIVMSEYSSRVLRRCIWSTRRQNRSWCPSWHSRLALRAAGGLQGCARDRGKACIAHFWLAVS